jgi:hypothetical protein
VEHLHLPPRAERRAHPDAPEARRAVRVPPRRLPVLFSQLQPRLKELEAPRRVLGREFLRAAPAPAPVNWREGGTAAAREGGATRSVGLSEEQADAVAAVHLTDHPEGCRVAGK